MATVKLTCTGNNFVQYQLPSFAASITVTITQANNTDSIWVTTDGTAPQAPTSTPRTDGSNQVTIDGPQGSYAVLHPAAATNPMVAPLVRIASTGGPTVELAF